MVRYRWVHFVHTKYETQSELIVRPWHTVLRTPRRPTWGI